MDLLVLLLSMATAFGEGVLPAEEPAAAPLTRRESACQETVNSEECNTLFRTHPALVADKRDCGTSDAQALVDSLKGCGMGAGGVVADAVKSIIGLFATPELSPTGQAYNRAHTECFQKPACRESAYRLGLKHYSNNRQPSAEEIQQLQKIPMNNWRRVEPFVYGMLVKFREWKSNESLLFLRGIMPGYVNFMREMKKLDETWDPQFRLIYQSQNIGEEGVKLVRNTVSFLDTQRVKMYCLNDVAAAELLCYGVFSVVDPTVAVGMIMKSTRLKALFGVTARSTRVLQPAKVDFYLDNNAMNALIKTTLGNTGNISEVKQVERMAKYFGVSVDDLMRNRDVFDRMGFTTTLRDELAPNDMGFFSNTMPLSPAQPSPNVITTLEKANLGEGGAKGVKDRQLVGELFATSQLYSKPVTFFTSDRSLINKLCRLAPACGDPRRVDVLRTFPNGFDVTIDGGTIHVVPLLEPR